MEKVELKAKTRQETGKKPTKGLRKAGLIPAVVYRDGKKTTHIFLEQGELVHALSTKAGTNVLINLKLDEAAKTAKAKERVVMIKEVQHHPIKSRILHVDFHEISLTDRIAVDVPVITKGQPEGVVKDEGILEHVMWQIKVECLPTEIPEKIEVDVAALKIGDSILVKDLPVPSGIKVLADPGLTVVSVVPPRAEEVAAPAVEEAVAEPELIRKEKEKEEEAGEGEAPPAAKPEEGKKKEEKK